MVELSPTFNVNKSSEKITIFLVKVRQIKIRRNGRKNNIFNGIFIMFFLILELIINVLLILVRLWTEILGLLLFIIYLLRLGNLLLNWIHLFFVILLRDFLHIFCHNWFNILSNLFLLNWVLLYLVNFCNYWFI